MYLAKRLNFTLCRNIAQKFSTQISTKNQFVVENLSSRSLIRVEGEMIKQFLQDLVTNDMNHLTSTSNSMYAMFLNKSGRVLYDSIIYKSSNDAYLIECDKDVENDLKKHLTLFRVRKKIKIDIIGNDFNIWVAFNPNGMEFPNKIADNVEIVLSNIDVPAEKNILLSNDPRLKYLGTRIIAPSTTNISDVLPKDLYVLNTSNKYKQYRYQLGIAEGSAELPTGKCFPLESNCDYLHGVSFHKGCYLGQELTARTYHTGVIRKRLMPLHLDVQLTDACGKHIESTHGDAIGKLRGFDNEWGIGLLKVESALKETSPFVIGGTEVSAKARTVKPIWWPIEAPPVQSLKEKNTGHDK